MFANDFDRGGVTKSYLFSITVHLLIIFLIFFYQQKQKSKLADYTLTEITIIQEIPDQPKPIQPVQIEKPKNMMDVLKQVIPIKQNAQIEIAKPKSLDLEKPKLEMQKPEALSLDKTKLEDLKPAAKAIDLDNEIGQKKISPAMVQAQIDLQKKQSLASAPSTKIDLGTQTKKSSILPAANPGGISLSSNRETQTGIKQSSFKLGKPTPEPKKSLATEKIVIEKKQALLIQGDIEGRQILVAKKPSYPRWAQEQGLEATVTIYFVVRPDGTVKDNLIIERSSNYPELDNLAKEALLQFKFAPIPGSDDQSGYATFRFMLER
ncbi:MAG: TonB family protein [Candidatus Goldbacteria bacterium]|nr:TonB family protein [Candidatus Goldiibacteriota bacterium]